MPGVLLAPEGAASASLVVGVFLKTCLAVVAGAFAVSSNEAQPHNTTHSLPY
jgi:hypothetical protein